MVDKKGKKNNVKIRITIRAVLLAISLLSLVGMLLCNQLVVYGQTSTPETDNIITSEKENQLTMQNGNIGDGRKAESAVSVTLENDRTGGTEEIGEKSSERTLVSTFNANAGRSTKAASRALSLHRRNPKDNIRFNVDNMLPGDKETKYYCVRVLHKGDVTLRFKAEVRPGYEKLSDVLRCRVILPDAGIMLYDGLMTNMPESVNFELHTDSDTASEVYYEITAYLDTSVGNEYMNRELASDFNWWVEETENLYAPQTGDAFFIYLTVGIASVSLILLILFWKKRKKEKESDER